MNFRLWVNCVFKKLFQDGMIAPDMFILPTYHLEMMAHGGPLLFATSQPRTNRINQIPPSRIEMNMPISQIWASSGLFCLRGGSGFISHSSSSLFPEIQTTTKCHCHSKVCVWHQSPSAATSHCSLFELHLVWMSVTMNVKQSVGESENDAPVFPQMN